jgi:hypothetical protein
MGKTWNAHSPDYDTFRYRRFTAGNGYFKMR